MAIALNIQALRKVYDSGMEALKGVDLQVKEGDFFALLGPNGAGKSTTIGIISSLVKKTSGRVSIFGIDIDDDFPAAKRYLGLVPQEFNFSQFEKVFDIVATQAGYYGIKPKPARQRAEETIKILGLWDKRSVQARMLSGGMKRRLMIARALVHQPKLLILDEPTAGVDIELRRSMWDFLSELNERGTTIILTTHYLEEAESLCRNIAIIDHGQIVENSSIPDLLAKLDSETFLLDTVAPLEKAPDASGFDCKMLGEHSLQVSVPKQRTLNELFSLLQHDGIQIASMKNKANRLEELFISLVKSNLDT